MYTGFRIKKKIQNNQNFLESDSDLNSSFNIYVIAY